MPQLSLPPTAKSTVITLAILLTAAGGGSGIGAAVASIGGGSSRETIRALEEVSGQLSKIRIEYRTANEELAVKIGLLERRMDARESNARANLDAARSLLRTSRDPSALEVLELLGDP